MLTAFRGRVNGKQRVVILMDVLEQIVGEIEDEHDAATPPGVQ